MHVYLLQAVAQNPDSAYWYLPVGLQLLFAIFLVGMLMVVTHLLGPSRKRADKLANFESGIESATKENNNNGYQKHRNQEFRNQAKE